MEKTRGEKLRMIWSQIAPQSEGETAEDAAMAAMIRAIDASAYARGYQDGKAASA